MNSSKLSKRNQYVQRKFDISDSFDHVYYRPSKSRGHVFKSIVAAKEAGFIDFINFRLTRCKIERLLQENGNSIGLDNLPKLYFERFNRVLVYDGKLSKALKCSMPKLSIEDWGRMIVSLKPRQQTVDAQFNTQPQQLERTMNHVLYYTYDTEVVSFGRYSTNLLNSASSLESPQSSSSPYINQGSLPYDPNNPICDEFEIIEPSQNKTSSSSSPAVMFFSNSTSTLANEDNNGSNNCYKTQPSFSQFFIQPQDNADLKTYSQNENQIWLHSTISVRDNQMVLSDSGISNYDYVDVDKKMQNCDICVENVEENDCGRSNRSYDSVDNFEGLTELQQTIIELLLFD
ncbi:3052_t:CDS:2 [Ambispora leptoticha]|uniref:3052_t:CDS:1 n=1 Tax=Ambispora leptoticha TaxID=144679 RepID=A0A9N8WQ89_9GLOM|nr:3052_t:CDS:2 [Ambispora leptoticha]